MMIRLHSLFRVTKNTVVVIPTRQKKTKRWTTSLQKNQPSIMALSHFDTLYRQQYSDLWPAIRIALLSKQKYGALINNFCQNEDFLNFLTEQDATDFVHDGAIRLRQACQHIDESKDDSTVVIDMNTDVKHNKQDEEFYISPNTEYIGRDAARISSHLSHKTEFETYHIPNKINTIKYDFNVSPHLKCFIHGNEQRFTNPYYDAAIGTMAYYIMDASSILPVIALDIQPDDVILDMCAAPGGKALAMLQTMYVGGLVVNDPAYSRRLSLKSVISSYMPKSMITGDMLRITKYDGTKWSQLESNVYDKVLVDVPCTTDRHVLHNNDNNIFSRSRNKERQSLPSLQSELLSSAIHAVKAGGFVVYATCTLSQHQNDYVIQNVLSKCKQQNIDLSVVNTSPIATAFSNVFNFYSSARYGQLVLPSLKANFGPMYFCKLQRLN